MLALVLAFCAAQSPGELYNRAAAAFAGGAIEESVRAFDALVRAAPQSEPQLWQRGIAQYYARQFKQCRAQFELHRTVNPDDVENAAYHYFCLAGSDGADAARRGLLPVGPDSRRPMEEVYRLLKGELKPEDVLAAGRGQASAEFFANLYVGLYYEAQGDTKRALACLRRAADPRFAAAGGYMHTVARVHVQLRAGKR